MPLVGAVFGWGAVAVAPAAATGKYISNVVPLGVLDTTTKPRLCLTMPYTVARPRPVPLPWLFVVKNGSKMCATTSGGMPMPVSVTVVRTCGPAVASG